MTIKEAIQRIQTHSEILIKKQPLAVYTTEALNMAVKALEKQMPKKPILDAIFPSGIEWYFCPACNHNGIEKTGTYCHSCGQALDWSVKNDRSTEKS